MLKYLEVNPLNVHNLRQVNHLPPHFSSAMFDLYIDKQELKGWIFENLEGRFYADEIDTKDSSGRYIRKMCVAFELPGELSYFLLLLSEFNNFSL